MNYKNGIGCFLFLIIALTANAQQKGDTAATAGAPNIWLTNSNKTIIKEKGITVDRVFFTAEKVYIGSNTRLFKKGEQYNTFVCGAKASSLFSEESALLTEAMKQKILSEPAGTQIIFSRGRGKNYSSLTVILQ